MTESNIKFNLSSVFKGEGFQKATKVIDSTAKTTQKAARAIGDLTGGLSGIDGQFGKIAAGIGDVVMAVASGQAAFVAISMAIGACVNKFNELQLAMKEHAEAARTLRFNADEVEGAYRRLQMSVEGLAKARAEETYGSSIEFHRSEIKVIDELAKSYAALSAAEEKVKSGSFNVKVSKITDEFSEALSKAATEIEKGVITASKDLALAQAENAEKIRKASDAVEIERSKREDIASKISEYKTLIETMTAAGQDVTKQEQELEKLEEQLGVQTLNLTAAQKEEEAVRISAETAEREALEAVDKAKDAVEREAEAREEAALALEDEAETQKAIKEEYAKLLTSLKAAESSYNALAKEYANVQKGRQKTQEGMAADAQYHQGISGEGYTYSTNADGNVDNFIDWQRAQRYQGRAARDAESQAKRNDSSQRRYDDIMAKENKGQSLSDREKKFKDDYENFENQARSDKDWQHNLKDAADAIDEIKEKMEDLGMK